MPALYKVLYTRQKTQKTKRWAEGFLAVSAFGSIKLLDEGRRELDSDFKKGGRIEPGDEIEFERFLVEVDELLEAEDAPGRAHESQRAVVQPPAHSASAVLGGVRVPSQAACCVPRVGLRAGGPRFAPLHPRSDANGARALVPVKAVNGPNSLSKGKVAATHDFGLSDYENRRTPPYRLGLQNWGQDATPRADDAWPSSAPYKSCPANDARGSLELGSHGGSWPADAARGSPEFRPRSELQRPLHKPPPRTNADILKLLGVPSSSSAGQLESNRERTQVMDVDKSPCPVPSSSTFACEDRAQSTGRFSGYVPANWGPAPAGGIVLMRGNRLLEDDDATDGAPGVQGIQDIGDSPGGKGGWPSQRKFSSSISHSDRIAEESQQAQEEPQAAQQDPPDSRNGFLALKDHQKPSGGYTIPLSSNKRPRLLGLGGAPSSFSAPRALKTTPNDASERMDCSAVAASGQHSSLQQGFSLLEENRQHLKHDREVQARFRAAADAKRAEKERPAVALRPAGGIIFPDARAAQEMGDAVDRRTVQDVFASPAAYKSCFIAALEEEINIRLLGAAHGLFRALRGMAGSGKGSLIQCNCRPKLEASCKAVKKEGANHGRLFFSCRACNFFKWADELTASQAHAEKEKEIDVTMPPNLPLLRQRQQAVYACQVISTERRDFQQINARRKAGQMDAGMKRETRVCLRMTEDSFAKSKVPGCSKDDLWVISSSPYFTADKTAITVMATSAWYGADGDNNIEVKPLVGQLSALKNRHVCYAFKAINVSSEIDMLDTLKEFSPAEVPLLPALLTGGTRVSHAVSSSLPLRKMPSVAIEIDQAEMLELEEAAIAKYRLNREQAQVIKDIARAVMCPEASPPVVLVQGVFGSGKSTLLVAVILFLISVFEKAGVPADAPQGRILISAATNVAVDNILLGLQEKGYDQFLRIGCLPRIAKPILTRTLKETVGNEELVDSESLKDLNEMLTKARDDKEKAQIRAAIAECRAGKMREKKKALGHTRVVGVTCASTRQETLQGQSFGFLILDECSQFIEPLCLLPIVRFACRMLIGAGDPRQLPPTLSGAEGPEASNDLGKTLFTRLANTGVEPVLLRVQYRCHPCLGTLASDLFYESKLVNGVTEEERRPLVNAWPALMFFDSAVSREQQQASSFFNTHEARFIVHLVSKLIDNGLQGSDIGVICLYKAQEATVRDALQGAADARGKRLDGHGGFGVQVSTVDAFQGGEKEIILLSCCRTSALGFTASSNRMNVAVTRARRHLVVVGHAGMLHQNQQWKEIIQRAKSLPGGSREIQEYLASTPDLQVSPVSDDEAEAGPGEQQSEDEEEVEDLTEARGRLRKRVEVSSDEDIFMPFPQRRRRAKSGKDGKDQASKQGAEEGAADQHEQLEDENAPGGASRSEPESQDSDRCREQEEEEEFLAHVTASATNPAPQYKEATSNGDSLETAGRREWVPATGCNAAATPETRPRSAAGKKSSPVSSSLLQEAPLPACNSHVPLGSIPAGARPPPIDWLPAHADARKMGQALSVAPVTSMQRARKAAITIPTFDLAASDDSD